jgi:intracellular sulfur oxidation DsrE/DsrF family protein
MHATKNHGHSRRDFLGVLATGVATAGVATIAPLTSGAEVITEKMYAPDDPDAWFNQIKGKHRIVFDATEPNGVMPFAWPRVFLVTNELTGTPSKNTSVVVILRHNAIPYALNNGLWEKYKLGEVFKVNDNMTNAVATHNAFWQPKAGDFKLPGVGNVAIGINELQDNGVMFAVCNMALTVFSAAVAEKMNMDANTVYNDWKAGILPKIQLVPSGVWAVGRAQEHGCAYCFAG